MKLVAICIMSRASCITTFCPTLEDMGLPPPRHWNKDGLPKYIILVLRNWKSRAPASVGKPYPVKIHRKYLNPTFCPVTWLLYYLRYSGHTSGPVFQGADGAAVTADFWCGMTNHLFVQAGLRTGRVKANPELGIEACAPKGCSNHSIRRSAAQWAGRCGAREMDVRNAGRWRSMDTLARYMAQGAKQREAYEADGARPNLQDVGFQEGHECFHSWTGHSLICYGD